jgi:hypothetical protein
MMKLMNDRHAFYLAFDHVIPAVEYRWWKSNRGFLAQVERQLFIEYPVKTPSEIDFILSLYSRDFGKIMYQEVHNNVQGTIELIQQRHPSNDEPNLKRH